MENIDSFAFLGDVEDERREDDVWRERVPPDDLPAYDAVAGAQARGQGGAAEYRLVRARTAALARLRPLARRTSARTASRSPSGVVSDVTALKEAEAALREREEQFRQLAIVGAGRHLPRRPATAT